MNTVSTKNLFGKRAKLEAVLRDLESVVVAFSGGVDSALVLAVAKAVLGDQVLAVTADSPSLPRRELEQARQLARQLKVAHRVIPTSEMGSPDYTRNPVNRCYFCKTELYTHLKRIAAEEHYAHIVNGTNRDDMADHRPGLDAARETEVVSPLYEAGLTKKEVRAVSRDLGLPTWDKPAMACLSSRIPYGQEVTPEKLEMIERAEDYLLGLGFRQVRVRHHGEVARIEVPTEDLPRLISANRARSIADRFRQLGFQYVTLDIEGFRSGSLNEVFRTNP